MGIIRLAAEDNLQCIRHAKSSSGWTIYNLGRFPAAVADSEQGAALQNTRARSDPVRASGTCYSTGEESHASSAQGRLNGKLQWK